MKIFKSDDLTTPIERLDLGIVMAGDKKRFDFIVENDSAAELVDLTFKPDSAEVKVVESPKKIKAYERASLTIEWAPSVTLKAGLKTSLQIKGSEIWS